MKRFTGTLGAFGRPKMPGDIVGQKEQKTLSEGLFLTELMRAETGLFVRRVKWCTLPVGVILGRETGRYARTNRV